MTEIAFDRPALVTGASGFIGRRLVARLLDESAQVRALVLPSEDVDGIWPGSVDVVRGDVTDAASAQRAVEGCGVVFHLAAVVSDWGDESVHDRVTVGGTRHTLEACCDFDARAVLASSVVYYGDSVGTAVLTEDRPPGRSLGPYSRSKQAQETVAWGLVESRGLALSVVRPVNVYGPGSQPWVHDVAAQLKGGLPSLIDGGDHNAGLAYVDNVVDVFVRAGALDSAVGRAYNVCDGSDVTWRQYFGDLARILGAPPPRSLPGGLARAGATVCERVWRFLRVKARPPLTHEALNLVGANIQVPIDRARDELGYEPRIGYGQGLAEVAAYIEQAGLAK